MANSRSTHQTRFCSCKKTDTADHVRRFFYDYVHYYETPFGIVSNRDTTFQESPWQTLLTRLGTMSVLHFVHKGMGKTRESTKS